MRYYLSRVTEEKIITTGGRNFEIWKRSRESEEILSKIMNVPVYVYIMYGMFNENWLQNSWFGVFSNEKYAVENEAEILMEMDEISYNEAYFKAKDCIFNMKEDFKRMKVKDCFDYEISKHNQPIDENGDWSGSEFVVSVDDGKTFFQMQNSEWAMFGALI